MCGRRPCGRLNHKPLAEYVAGVEFITDEEAVLLRQPNTPEEEKRCDEIIRRKAAEK
jgi:hypothetical protein